MAAIENTPRLLRERWIARLNAAPEVQALSLTFQDRPALAQGDIDGGSRRGFVLIGEEAEVGGGLLDVELVTVIVAGAAGGTSAGKDAADLLDDARLAVLTEFRRDPEFSNLAGMGRYAGTVPLYDGEGRRFYGIKTMRFLMRIVNPISETL
ncbi:MAG: hypothetical protein ACQGVC_18260 [Myxococcota bacterium]